jgi:hypothetical protein
MSLLKTTAICDENFNVCTCKSEIISELDSTVNSYFTEEKITELTKKAKQLLTETITNMSTGKYIPLDNKKNVLPLKENIPQGEEASMLYLKDPRGSMNQNELSYVIIRYGIPEVFDYTFDRYDNYKQIFEYQNECIFSKFDCYGHVNKIIAMDYDKHVFVCDKHKNLGFDLVDINIANIKDLHPFYHEYCMLKLAEKTNNLKKINLLKKIKIIMELAQKGILKKYRLDKTFKLYGIHFYEHKFDHKNKNGWALVYTDFKDKIAHIFLDELTDDQEVKEALALFAYENIMAKQYHDLPYITSYINNGKKAQFKQLTSMANNTYMFDIPYILHYKLNI